MLEVWFIRHGESISNAGLPTSDTVVTSITERGRIEAEAIAHYMPATPDLIVTSPYLRTKQTAEPTMARFPTVPHQEWPVHEFTYLGLPHNVYTTFQQRRPLSDAFWERCDPHECAEGAESFAGLMLRIAATRERIGMLSQGFVLVFSHGLFMKALLWSLVYHVAEVSPTTMSRYRAFIRATAVPNGSILKLRSDERGELWLNGILTDHLAAIDKGVVL
jgi:broad specificity phosphatase PhoE